MKHQHYLAVFLLALLSHWSTAQTLGEAGELSPEELDAAFTEADAVREAAKWSDVIIERKPPDPIGNMAAAADLVFYGTVASQSVVYDAQGLPNTHTVVSITDVLKGSFAASEITVIQEGGPSSKNPDKVIMVSDALYFTPGDEEILFLQLDPDNTYEDRRVRVQQRFSIYQGKVYNENGRGLIYTATAEAPGYRLGWSRDRNPQARFREVQVGPHMFTKQFREEKDSPDYGGDTPDDQSQRTRPGYQSSMDISTFATAIAGDQGDKP